MYAWVCWNNFNSHTYQENMVVRVCGCRSDIHTYCENAVVQVC